MYEVLHTSWLRIIDALSTGWALRRSPAGIRGHLLISAAVALSSPN